MEHFPEFREKKDSLARYSPIFESYVSGISVSLDIAPGISGNFDCNLHFEDSTTRRSSGNFLGKFLYHFRLFESYEIIGRMEAARYVTLII